MAVNDTSDSQDQHSDRDVSTIVQTSRGDGNKPSTTGNGKTSKNQKREVNGEMKTNKTNTTSSGNITRHAPKLPTRTNKTKKRSAGTTTTTTETTPKTSTNGLPTAQPSSSSASSRPAMPVVTHHHRALNPLLLARGMSSRYLSTKIISASSINASTTTKTVTTTTAVAPTTTATSILPLSKTEIEKDLRHMEAYRAASIGYGQQLFVYKNQDLVRSGYFGSFFVEPGVLGDDNDGEHIVGGDGYYHPAASMVEDDTVDGREPYNEDDGQDEVNKDDMLSHRLPDRLGGVKRGPSSHRQRQQQQPQQHNRGRPFLPIKIDPEEEKRLSGLRKRMHQSEFVRMQLETQYLSLRSHYVHECQLVRKTRSYEMEGRLKLMREVMVRREKVLALMRVKMAIWRDVEVKLMGYRDGWNIVGTENDAIIKTAKDSGSDATGEKVEIKEGVVNDDSKEVDLLKIWNDIHSQLRAAEAACMELETPEVLTQMVVTPMPTPPSSSASSATSIAKNGRKRSGSVTSTEELVNSTNDSSSGKRRVSSTTGLEPHIIPWDCMVEPQTPYDFPLLLSCLSSATDKVVGYVTDRTNPSAITWLESTLPRTTSAYNNDAKDLKKLQDEVRTLEDQLQCECVRNTELREQINASRTRSDEMVALMQLLRSETEAVLERHNVIMETPEARAKAAELHKRRIEEKNPLAEGEEEEEEEDDDEEGEVDENEEFSSGEEEINRYEQESDDELYDSVGIKEITVDNDSNNEAGESDDEDEDGSDGGDVAVDDLAEEEEPRTRNKRRGQEDEDEMSNSVSTPPNSSSYRKRRRY